MASLVDEELATRAELRGFRHALFTGSTGTGCVVGLFVAGAALVLLVHRASIWTTPLWLLPALGAGVFATVVAAALLRVLALGRKGRYVRELQRRYGSLRLGVHANDEREVPGLTCSLLARCHGLPHGEVRFIRMRTHAVGPPSVEGFGTPADPDWVSGAHPRDVVVRTRRALTDTEERELASLLAGLPWGTRNHSTSGVRDGQPCEMQVLDHAEGTRYVLRCNLAGLPKEADEHPGVRLLAFARSRVSPRADGGATSFDGGSSCGAG